MSINLKNVISEQSIKIKNLTDEATVLKDKKA